MEDREIAKREDFLEIINREKPDDPSNYYYAVSANIS